MLKLPYTQLDHRRSAIRYLYSLRLRSRFSFTAGGAMRGFAHFYLIRNEPDRRQLAVTLRGLGRQKCVLSMEEDKCRECLGRIFAEYWQSARLPTTIDRAQSLKEFIASCPCSTLILDRPDESDRSFFLRQVRGGGQSGEFVS